MYDSCRIWARTDGVDRYSRAKPGYTAAPALTPCGFDPTGGQEVMNGAEVEIADAALRLPVGTAVKAEDGIEVTHRWGDALAPTLKFYITGPPEIGPSGIVVKLREQKDNAF